MSLDIAAFKVVLEHEAHIREVLARVSNARSEANRHYHQVQKEQKQGRTPLDLFAMRDAAIASRRIATAELMQWAPPGAGERAWETALSKALPEEESCP